MAELWETWGTRRGQILAAVMDRLRLIQVVSGYHFNVKGESVTSSPVNILTIPEPLLPFFLVELSPSSRDFHQANEIEIQTRILITWRGMANGLNPERKTQFGEALVGDVERVLERDITLGGLTQDLRMQEPDGPMSGMGANNNVFGVIELEAHHVREYGLP